MLLFSSFFLLRLSLHIFVYKHDRAFLTKKNTNERNIFFWMKVFDKKKCCFTPCFFITRSRRQLYIYFMGVILVSEQCFKILIKFLNSFVWVVFFILCFYFKIKLFYMLNHFCAVLFFLFFSILLPTVAS